MQLLFHHSDRGSDSKFIVKYIRKCNSTNRWMKQLFIHHSDRGSDSIYYKVYLGRGQLLINNKSDSHMQFYKQVGEATLNLL